MNTLLAFADVMRMVGGVVIAIVILLVMITVHEFGHYVAGKILGFKINEFSIGFGPAILKKRSKKTGELFAVRVVPLGGYCAFDGEDYEEETETPANVQEEPFEETRRDPAPVQTETVEEKKEEEYPEPKGEKFNDQPPWKRIIVLVAGALMNYFLALILLLIMVGTYGVPMCIALPVGYQSGDDVPHAAWETETLSYRDILVSVNGVEIDMITDCIDALQGKKEGESVPARVLRRKDDGYWHEKEVILTLAANGDFENMADVETLKKAMGIEIFTTTVQRDFWHTVGGAFEYSFEMGTSVLRSLGELVTGKLGADAVGGPVTTITVTAQAATASPFSLLYIASFIGVNLAVFNLLPVPALDGCKVIFCIIEWIRKKPINRKVETIIHFVGIVALFAFAILVDLLHLFA
ncbi:MAG: site-2 protease family protein [Clostridia bacterium]|nr:site-2 protease family protein [Clostridia bacterium]